MTFDLRTVDTRFYDPSRDLYDDARARQLVAEELRALRKMRGMTQAQVAAVLGIGPSAISGYERLKKNLTLAHLQAYARAVGAEITLVVEIEEQPTPGH